ncbi:SubName: Full=Uncharacterized protein {ECO:0000313/EMBL:CCA76391.1}; Flags: Fragment [Serendipita indica DSM 11827]|nr:SubName: Full=Uncharacterized protein {ECO:0000313/EMBL:CCA76391.1}; Flags: Fragment [Serendipita indica DSM 11827]
MNSSTLPSIWTLYLEEVLPEIRARKRQFYSLLQIALVFLTLCLASSLTAAQILIQDWDEDSSDLIYLVDHISLQIFNGSTPAAGYFEEPDAEPTRSNYELWITVVFVLGFSLFVVLISITLSALIYYESDLPAAHLADTRGRAVAVTTLEPVLARAYKIALLGSNLVFMFVGVISVKSLVGYLFAGTFILCWLLGGLLFWRMDRRKSKRKARDLDYATYSFTKIPGLSESQQEELPVLTRLCITGAQEPVMLKYVVALQHINAWRMPIPYQLGIKSLGWYLNRFLRYGSLPHEYPKTYDRGEVELLPILAECAADQYISGLDYVRDEDEACSHTEAREGGISALFGDLSALKHPSRIELDVIVRLVLWRNRASIWSLSNNRTKVLQTNPRLCTSATSHVRNNISGSDNANFIIWVTTELPLFADLIGISDSSLSSYDKLRFCTLICSSPWFPHYISQGDIREYIVELMEKEAPNETPSHPYLNLCPLIDSLGRDDDDETTTARFTALRGLTVSRAYAPHVTAIYSVVSLESQVETVVSQVRNSWEA